VYRGELRRKRIWRVTSKILHFAADESPLVSRRSPSVEALPCCPGRRPNVRVEPQVTRSVAVNHWADRAAAGALVTEMVPKRPARQCLPAPADAPPPREIARRRWLWLTQNFLQRQAQRFTVIIAAAGKSRRQPCAAALDALNTRGHQTGNCAQRHDGAGPVKSAPGDPQLFYPIGRLAFGNPPKL
jgi:hypothetical protein